MINRYEEAYYILYPDDDTVEYDIDLMPSPYTASTHWKFEKLNFGDKPLSFTSDNEDLDFLKVEHAIAFSVPNFVVTAKLKKLLDVGIYGGQFYPAIIHDEQGNYIEGMWALNTYKELDCIDFKRSQYYMPSDGSKEIDGFKIYADMDVYRLREDVLDAIPEEERLIFQVAGASVNEVFVHKRVVDIFKGNKVKGVKFFKVSEFSDGDQH
ncbi:imm11 family protein [Vibrio mexicanus]|uniref:imm11 family protein n=1 Tax=Vibrio mexicanus TaxID=1004326 RepID=UPI000AD70C83|nr:DUF1629 domain-containing protein [Vibrio mexicanus]